MIAKAVLACIGMVMIFGPAQADENQALLEKVMADRRLAEFCVAMQDMGILEESAAAE